MILAYLILSHLVGDFVLQPTKLVAWKKKSLVGVLIHCLVHFVVSLVVLFPLILNGYISLIFIALAISVVHFAVDQAKISYDLRHDEKVKPFIIDQILHFLAILLVFLVISRFQFTLPEGPFYEFYSNIKLVYFLSFIIFTGSVIEIYRFQIEREKNKGARFKIHGGEMLKRMLVFTAIYIIFILLAVYSFKFL